MEKQFIAYFRVSTDKQGKSGLGIEAQQQFVNQYLSSMGAGLKEAYTEVESGKIDDRPELQKAVKQCRKTGATLIVAKLDRLSRNATFLLTFDDMIKKSGINLHICDQPHLDRFTLGIHALVAERERELISERTKAALRAAKERGVRLGTRDGAKLSKAGVATIKSRSRTHAENNIGMIEQIKASGASTYREISEALNHRGIPTARGGEWHPESVRRISLRS